MNSKKGICIAMINPEGYYHDIYKYGTINSWTVAPVTVTPTKQLADKARMAAADCVTYIRTSMKSI